MKNQQKIEVNYMIPAACMVFSIIVAGGYFEYASAVLAIVGVAFTVYCIFKERAVSYVRDYNTIALFIFTIMYLVTAMWAVDSGMAVMGFVKFLPVIFFYGIMCRIEKDREKLIGILPVIGVLIVLFSAIMMQFESLKGYVSVAGRMSGSFQYPNTFALFLLICLIVAVYSNDSLRQKAVYILGLAIGIICTGSRTVWIITFGTLLILALCNRKYRKLSCCIVIIGIVAIAIALIFAGNSWFAMRLKSISLSSSTFLGRLLYAKDAMKLILKHPFGLGYYGYYFMEQEIQTGVYSVVNVHNELLQMALDIGIIPAVLFEGMILRSVFLKKQLSRNRVILSIIAIHSLFDYDFQFIGMLFVMLLFLDYGKQQTFRVSSLTYSTAIIFAIVSISLAGICGISNLLYVRGAYEKAYAYGKMNTMAQIRQMESESELEKSVSIANSILKRNKHVPATYSTLAKKYYSDGNIQNYIIYELKAIKMQPYEINEYIDYVNSLAKAGTEYIDNNDVESAKICLDRMKEVPDILSEVEKQTSDIAWKIKDKPDLTIPDEYNELIKSMEEALNEKK